MGGGDRANLRAVSTGVEGKARFEKKHKKLTGKGNPGNGSCTNEGG